MTIQVYHQKNPTFIVLGKPDVVNREYFIQVASVHGNDLDLAYTLTNTVGIDKWWLNIGVVFLGSPDYGKAGCRSTSVGDVLVVMDEVDPAHSKVYLVMGSGFREVAWS